MAAAGIKVAKHGNRSITSKSGSADVLEALGIKLDDNVDSVSNSINQNNFGFMFAPFLHKAMKYAMPVRRGLGIRTIFNILGPLTNPANANCQLLGVFDPELTEVMANVLGNLGVKRALVVHGEGGLDEISSLGKTKVSELKNGDVSTYFIDPSELGIQSVKLKAIQGGDVDENAQIALDIFSGKIGPKRDIVVLNAAYSLFICGKVDSPKTGIKKAEEILDSGLALQKLKELKGTQ